MSYTLQYGAVREAKRSAIFVVRVQGALLETAEIGDIAERMRERLHARGETATDVVVMQGDSKETFRLFGDSYSVSRVRAALFSAAVRWTPIEL